jgi:enoyl-CoA hydratase/carnithine racemase
VRGTFKRPERLNAFHYPAVRDLDAIGRMLMADSDVRAVALQGEGRAFSTGLDLKDLAAAADIICHYAPASAPLSAVAGC